jgi:thioredoxin 1
MNAVTDGSFQSDVLESDQPVLVDFWAEWCQPCKMLLPTIEAVASTYDGRAKVYKMDIDENRVIAAQHNISTIPTLLFFKDGEVRAQLVGVQNESAIAAQLDALL